MRSNAISTFVLTFVLLAGCSSTYKYGQFTVASTNNVRNLKYSQDANMKPTSGETCIRYFIGIGIGETDDRLTLAMDTAIKNGRKEGLDGDLLVNVRIDRTFSNYLVYSSDCVTVKGDLVKITQ